MRLALPHDPLVQSWLRHLPPLRLPSLRPNTHLNLHFDSVIEEADQTHQSCKVRNPEFATFQLPDLPLQLLQLLRNLRPNLGFEIGR